MHDCIRLTKTAPATPRARTTWATQPPLRGWADGLSTGILLQQLLGAIEGLDCARAVALTEATWGARGQRKPLLRALALAASKFQNDPHPAQRGHLDRGVGLTTAERSGTTSCGPGRSTSPGVKRTTALDCVEQYERIMGVGAEGTAVASPRASMGLERGVMGTHSAGGGGPVQ